MEWWFSTWGQFYPQEDIEQHLETLLFVVSGGAGGYWHLAGRARDAAQHPTELHPHNKILSTQNVRNVGVDRLF